MTKHNISDHLRHFFEREAENTRTAITQGDLNPGSQLTLSTALDSLRQAPEDIQLQWMADVDNYPNDMDTMEEMWIEAFDSLLELAELINMHGGDTDLVEFL